MSNVVRAFVYGAAKAYEMTLHLKALPLPLPTLHFTTRPESLQEGEPWQQRWVPQLPQR